MIYMTIYNVVSAFGIKKVLNLNKTNFKKILANKYLQYFMPSLLTKC